MPQNEQISELISDKVFKDLEKLTQELSKGEQKLVDTLVAANNLNNALGNSKSASDVQSNAQKTNDAIKKIIDTQEKQRLAEIKLQQDREKAFDKFEANIKREQDGRNKIAATLERNAKKAQDIADKQRVSDIKLQQDREKSFDNYDKEQAKLAKQTTIAAEASREYNVLTKSLRDAENAALDLGAKFGPESIQFQEAAKAALELRTKVDALEQPLKKFGRNVGNYKGDFAGLGNSINQITREFPAFTNSVQTGFLAISNNLPIFFDEISKVNRVLKETAEGNAVSLGAQAKATALAGGASEEAANQVGELAKNQALAAAESKRGKEAFKAIASSLLSFETLLSLGVVALTVFGPVLYDYVKSLFKGKEAIDEFADRQKALNEVFSESSKEASKQLTTLKLEYAAATDVTNSMENRVTAANHLKEIYPEAFRNSTNMSILNGEESKTIQQITQDIIAQARARAIKSKLEANGAKELELDIQRDKINIKKRNDLNASDNPTGQMDAATAARRAARIQIVKDKIKNDADEAQLDVKNKKDALLREDKFLTAFAGGNEKLSQAGKEFTNQIKKPLENFDTLLKNAGSKAQLDNIKTALQDKLNALAPSDAQIKQYQDKIKKIDEVEKAYEPKSFEKKAKKTKDPAKDAAATYTQLLEGEKEHNELIQQNEKSSLDERLAAIDTFVKNSNELIEGRKNAELKAENLTADQIKIIRQRATNATLKIEVDAQKDRQQVAQDELKELEEKHTAQHEAAQTHDAALLAQIKASNADRLKEIEINKNKQLDTVGQQYGEGKISEKNYQKSVQEIEEQALRDRLATYVVYYKQLIKLKKAANIDTAAEEAALADVEASIDNQITNNKKKAYKTQAEYKKDIQKLEVQLAQELKTFVIASINGQFQAQIKNVDNEKDLVTKQQEQEIDAVNRSLGSQQQKADKIAVINAQAAAKQEALDAKKRDLQRKQAEFERALTIANIIYNTGAAVVAALKEPFPINLIESALIAAIGAAQIATVLATPLPQYFTGTKSSEEGLAIVGERGTEKVIEPSGKIWYTPPVPTLVNLVGGSEIINNKELMLDKEYMQSVARPERLSSIQVNNNDQRIVEALEKGNRETRLMREEMQAERIRRRPGIGTPASQWEAYVKAQLR